MLRINKEFPYDATSGGGLSGEIAIGIFTRTLLWASGEGIVAGWK